MLFVYFVVPSKQMALGAPWVASVSFSPFVALMAVPRRGIHHRATEGAVSGMESVVDTNIRITLCVAPAKIPSN